MSPDIPGAKPDGLSDRESSDTSHQAGYCFYANMWGNCVERSRSRNAFRRRERKGLCHGEEKTDRPRSGPVWSPK